MLRNFSVLGMLLVLAFPAAAQWELDNAHSSIYFISIKNDGIAETHYFESLLGYVGEEGQVSITIDLNSAETLIPIRNERLREMLFETATFPTATVSAEIDPAILAEVAKGATISSEVPVTLSLHGLEKSIQAPLAVVATQGGLHVYSAKPIVLNAGDFGLAGGIEKLREVAGLSTISTAVPVSFNLLFTPAEES